MTDSKNVDFKGITNDLICELWRQKFQNEAVQFVINSFDCKNFNTMHMFYNGFETNSVHGTGKMKQSVYDFFGSSLI